ncbi:hypothetical protein EJ05DRAFT_480843 [Pseudovirgaria hyperparasitica]|uniref:Uncharacterized protein n=1 Tax=Pseudovirgaria hyperparasitica TaxID=470096 RepID=A0A6A6VTK2_9PEZI|nr:uncharacterized protein EJ05DRAFT_480843 [Pseudovirgaria hyperparasitica]KAF2752930.1 hypothetical protein EJ05DRAFT_480843 [Pseudovirgaria hyperparasitica]
MEHFERLKIRHMVPNSVNEDEITAETLADGDHMIITINNGWSKMNKYFIALNESPAYYAAINLHPNLKTFCRSAWDDYEDSESIFRQY